jgi:hypothetical protein
MLKYKGGYMDFRKSLRNKLSNILVKLTENVSNITIPVDELSPEAIAKKHNVPVEDVKKEIEIGTSHEQEEHGDIARHIASQHVNEHPKFYTDKQYGADVTEKQLDEVDQNQIKNAQIDAAKAQELAASKKVEADTLQAQAAKDATQKASM